MLLRTKTSFDASHNLAKVFPAGHKCANLHGHTWGVEVTIDTQDKFIDFTDFKAKVKAVIENYDHKHLNSFVDVPISEYLAIRLAYEMMKQGLNVVNLKIAESPNNIAIFDSRSYFMYAALKEKAISGEYWHDDIDMLTEIYDYRYHKSSLIRKSGSDSINIGYDLIELSHPGLSALIGNCDWQMKSKADIQKIEVKLTSNFPIKVESKYVVVELASDKCKCKGECHCEDS